MYDPVMFDVTGSSNVSWIGLENTPVLRQHLWEATLPNKSSKTTFDPRERDKQVDLLIYVCFKGSGDVYSYKSNLDEFNEILNASSIGTQINGGIKAKTNKSDVVKLDAAEIAILSASKYRHDRSDELKAAKQNGLSRFAVTYGYIKDDIPVPTYILPTYTYDAQFAF